MKELKFKSQIATTKEQSKRLLELGLNPETADMVYEYDCTYPYDCHLCILEDGDYISSNIITDSIPAWSLHRLIDLCGAECMPISFYKKGKILIRVNHIHPTHNGRSNYNHYDSLIDCIAWLIKENYFNKEDLKQ